MQQTDKICEKYCTRRLANLTTSKCPFCFESCSTIRKTDSKFTVYRVKCVDNSTLGIKSEYEQEFSVTDKDDEALLIEERTSISKQDFSFGGGISKQPWNGGNVSIRDNTTYTTAIGTSIDNSADNVKQAINKIFAKASTK